VASGWIGAVLGYVSATASGPSRGSLRGSARVSAFFIGAMLCVTGIAFLWRRKKRIFERTNRYGVEEFRSYWGKLLTRAKDGTIHVIGLTLLTVGALAIGIAFEDSWGWVITIPFYLLILFALLGT